MSRLTLQKARYLSKGRGKRAWTVRTSPGFMTDGGKPLPYGTTIGVVHESGKVSVWMPAAYTPRGYKSAAKRALEDIVYAIRNRKKIPTHLRSR